MLSLTHCGVVTALLVVSSFEDSVSQQSNRDVLAAAVFQTRLIRSLFMTEESVQSTSYLAFLSFFKFFSRNRSCEEIFYKKVQNIVNYKKIIKNVATRWNCFLCVFVCHANIFKVKKKKKKSSQYHIKCTGNAVKPITTNLFIGLKWLKIAVHSFWPKP